MKKVVFVAIMIAAWSQSAFAECICNHLPCSCPTRAVFEKCPWTEYRFCPIRINPLEQLPPVPVA